MTFNTHAAFKALTGGGGFSSEQAEILVSVLGQSNDDVATKSDLNAVAVELRGEFKALRMEIRVWVLTGVVVLLGAIRFWH
ncbi:MAG TPA: hypothetical protein VGH74_07755 [Planctomycetaceae bacterium]|jgi:hypothetical protein